MAETALKVAKALYYSGCLKFGSFHIKSGALSPYYIDLACLLAKPRHLCTIVTVAANKIKGISRSCRLDKLASIELKGALIVPSIGCRTNIPCVVVRKEQKTYGAVGRIAGASIEPGDNVLFFDDVISEGLSKLEAVRPLEELGAKIENILVVVDRQQGGKENLQKLGYKVHALAEVSDLVESLYESSEISEKQRNTVLNFIRKT